VATYIDNVVPLACTTGYVKHGKEREVKFELSEMYQNTQTKI
jgi:hypothetical protein